MHLQYDKLMSHINYIKQGITPPLITIRLYEEMVGNPPDVSQKAILYCYTPDWVLVIKLYRCYAHHQGVAITFRYI